IPVMPQEPAAPTPTPVADLADALPTPTPTSPVLAPRPSAAAMEAPPMPMPAPQARVSLPGSGVRAPSRSRRLLRIMRPAGGSGPGLSALLLILLAAVLAATAVLLRLRRHARASQHVEMVQDAARSPTATRSRESTELDRELAMSTARGTVVAARGATAGLRDVTDAAPTALSAET